MHYFFTKTLWPWRHIVTNCSLLLHRGMHYFTENVIFSDNDTCLFRSRLSKPWTSYVAYIILIQNMSAAYDFFYKRAFINCRAHTMHYQSSTAEKIKTRCMQCLIYMQRKMRTRTNWVRKTRSPTQMIKEWVCRRQTGLLGRQSRFSDSNTVGQCAVIFGRPVSGVRTEPAEITGYGLQ